MKKFFEEFKKFISRGNVMDMAVGVIIGGAFLSAVINFLLIALVIFCIIKAMNTAKDKMLKKQEEEAPAPTTKKCPYCMSEIDIQATRCPHCTSELQ